LATFCPVVLDNHNFIFYFLKKKKAFSVLCTEFIGIRVKRLVLSPVVTLKNVISSIQAGVLDTHSAAAAPSFSIFFRHCSLFFSCSMSHPISLQFCLKIGLKHHYVFFLFFLLNSFKICDGRKVNADLWLSRYII